MRSLMAARARARQPRTGRWSVATNHRDTRGYVPRIPTCWHEFLQLQLELDRNLVPPVPWRHRPPSQISCTKNLALGVTQTRDQRTPWRYVLSVLDFICRVQLWQCALLRLDALHRKQSSPVQRAKQSCICYSLTPNPPLFGDAYTCKSVLEDTHSLLTAMHAEFMTLPDQLQWQGNSVQ